MKRAVLITIVAIWVQNPIGSTSPLREIPDNSNATLEIRFTGIRSNEGLIAIGINNSEEGWPRSPQMHKHWEKGILEDGVFVARIPDLPYGTYAVSVLDDENSNLEMDMFLGIPKEGWGFSMNPPLKMSAPKFSECSFRINQPTKQVSIDLRYAGKGR